MAREDAVNGPKIADSSGFSISRFIERQNAKYGKLSVHDFAKMHLIHTPQGKVCAAMVTPGKANDSPYLRNMIAMMPEGSGDVLGRCGVRGRQKLPRHTRQWPPGRHRRQVERHTQGAQRQGRDAEVPRRAPTHVPQHTAHQEQRERASSPQWRGSAGWSGPSNHTSGPSSCCQCASAII